MWTGLKIKQSPVTNLNLTLNALHVKNVCFDQNIFTLSSYKVILHVSVTLEKKNKSVVAFFLQVCRVIVPYQVHFWFAHKVIKIDKSILYILLSCL